jgi:hypothetical protein
MNRQDANLAIIEVLNTAALMYPNLRFGQIMSSLDVIYTDIDKMSGQAVIRDEYYVESEPLLNRVTAALDKLVAQQSQRENV